MNGRGRKFNKEIALFMEDIGFLMINDTCLLFYFYCSTWSTVSSKKQGICQIVDGKAESRQKIFVTRAIVSELVKLPAFFM